MSHRIQFLRTFISWVSHSDLSTVSKDTVKNMDSHEACACFQFIRMVPKAWNKAGNI